MNRSNPSAESSGHQKTITYSGVLHLSHAIAPNIPQWPGDPPVEFETVASLEKDGYYLRRFSLGEHSTTHINAPNSFHKNLREPGSPSPFRGGRKGDAALASFSAVARRKALLQALQSPS